MNRRTMPIAAALAATAALLLTACGGGGDKSNDKIKGAGDGSTASPSTSASATSGGVQRPKIELPASFQMTFDNWTNSDPKLQAILDDGKARLLGTYSAIIKQDPKADVLTFYSTDTALTTGEAWVKGFTDKNLTLIGTGRAFQPQARISPDGSGTLFYCVDEGKGSTKNLKTGKVVGTPANDNAYVFYRTKLKKSPNGVWQTSAVNSTRGECK